jgi:hypothetical protein
MTVVVDNHVDLNQELQYYDTVSHVGLMAKTEGELHKGHEECVKKAKELAEVTYVSFYKTSILFGTLFPEFKQGNSVRVMDLPYCLQWCEEHKVDVMYVPSEEDQIKIYLEDQDKKDFYLDQIKNIYKTEGYILDNEADQLYLYIFMFMDKIRYDDKLWKKTTHVTTWNDGYVRFCQLDFSQKYLNLNVYLIDPIKLPNTNLPFSTNGLNLFDPIDISILSDLRSNIENKIVSQKTSENIKLEIIDDLYKISNVKDGFKCEDVYIHSGDLVGNNTLITSHINMGGEIKFNSRGRGNVVILNNFFKGVKIL